VSAYQYPAMPPAYAGASSDPTAVMGRRTGAWIVDFLLWLVLGAFLGPTPLSPLAEYVDTNDFPGVDCEDVQRVNDVSSCIEVGDRLYFVEGSDAAIGFVVAWIIAPLAYAAVQGATGRSPGKALFGVRVVDEFGSPPGFGKSLVRTLLWVVDGIPCIIPLVGFITGLTSNGHRRVGDMAAKTFVVGKDHSGPVIVAGLPTAATQGYPGAAYGTPGQQWGAPPPGPPGQPGQPQPWGGPAPGGPGGPPSGGWDAQPSGGFPVPGAAPSGAPGGPGGPPGAGPSDRPAPPSGWAPPGVTPAPGTPGGPGTPPPTSQPGGPSPASSTTEAGSAAGRGFDRDTTEPGVGAPRWGAATEGDDSRGTDEASEPDGGEAPADTTPGPGTTTAGAATWTAGTTASSTTPPADAGAGPGTGPSTDATPGHGTAPSAAAGATGAEAMPADTGPATGASPEAGGAASAAAGPSDTDAAATSTPQAAPSGYNPQWDAARGTYIVWEPNRGKWLGWDESAQEWKPL
jgi:uncharacterized RDD family membrane protein YckC